MAKSRRNIFGYVSVIGLGVPRLSPTLVMGTNHGNFNFEICIVVDFGSQAEITIPQSRQLFIFNIFSFIIIELILFLIYFNLC